ncbi:MAG: type IV secretion system protein [Cyanobacteria bacterium SZAS LIN-2]|nr:type IV secretion system protein [Cyanobacteria bacterium SZAS LIN-2]
MDISRVRRRMLVIVATASLGAAVSLPARATGIPVIDVAALMQLIQQVLFWQNQLQQMQEHLGQLKATTTALTGSRGMQALLPIGSQARNYLPENWAGVTSLASGVAGAYSGLSGLVSAKVQGVSVLPNATLAKLTPAQRQLITDGRNSSAVLQALSETAYASTSSRFQQLQSLIQAIGGAVDTKAIGDLQGRIQAEQAMLQNEQTKLTVLYQAAQAERWSQEERMRELAVVQLGSPTTLNPVAY